MKIIKIDSCCKCPNKSDNNRCFMLSIKSDRVRIIRNDDIIHPDCPLEDYQNSNWDLSKVKVNMPDDYP